MDSTRFVDHGAVLELADDLAGKLGGVAQLLASEIVAQGAATLDTQLAALAALDLCQAHLARIRALLS